MYRTNVGTATYNGPVPDLSPARHSEPCDEDRLASELGVVAPESAERRHQCDQPGCVARFQKPSDLKRHKADVHNIDVVWHKCNLCTKSFKQSGDLNRHRAFVHNIGVVWHDCNLCTMSFKQSCRLNQHKARRHNVGVVLYKCNLCTMSFKQSSNLKTHKAYLHDVGVVWRYCDVTGCSSKFKRSSDLTRHMQRLHNAVYVARRKIQEERVRVALVADGFEEWFSSDTMPPVGFFKREHLVDFDCAAAVAGRDAGKEVHFCKIDFVIWFEWGYLFLEVDENQHRFGYDALLSCDARRVANVHTSIAVEMSKTELPPPRIYWLRYNPHSYHVDGELVEMPKEEREKRLGAFLTQLKTPSPVTIAYAWYDSSDGELEVLGNPEFPDVLSNVVVNHGSMETIHNQS